MEHAHSPKLLVIDDDEKLNRLLRNYFEKYQFQVLSALTPTEGFKKLEEKPDLVILDVMLPEMDGFEVCRRIRHQSQVPVIMLTARGDVMDRVIGLEMGADDYLPKPFEPRELLARIQSVLRRTNHTSRPPDQSAEILKFTPGLVIHLKKHEVTLNGVPLEMTSMEFALLSCLAQQPQTVLNRDQLLDHLRGIEWESYNRSVDVLMSRLRQKLGDDPKHPSYIKTVWGTGYIFVGVADET
ncbi:MAG: response regulator transcription factor [SAR324 cluster bacterium]|nr:response regulator transcription factor [SAR324 cluster bacterium]